MSRWFRRLLRLFPADFQADYGREMERTFRAQEREAHQRGARGLARLWIETLLDLLRTAPRQHVEQIWQDVRYTARTIGRRPAFAAATTLVFAIGIGGTTAVFSIVDAALLRPLPFEHPDRLVAIREQTSEDANPWELSYPSFIELRRDASSFEQLAACMRNGVAIRGSEPRLVDAAFISANLLETFGVRPIAGRAFIEREDAPGGEAVALVSHALARERFGSADKAVGGVLNIDGRVTTIVGVLADSFRFPNEEVPLWLPLGPMSAEPWMRSRGVHVADVYGRLSPDATLEAARAEATAWMNALQAREPGGDPGHRLALSPLAEYVSRNARPAVTALACAVLLLLTVTCSSVALLFLTRVAGRAEEVSIRLSLGATRPRLVRQLLTESACVALVGAALGVAAAFSVLAFLVRGLEDALPPFVVPSIDGSALAAAAAATGVAALVTGLAPVTKAGLFVRGPRVTGAAQQPLLTIQVAVSCVLVVAGALLGRSLDRLLRVDLGFRADQLLVMRVTTLNDLHQQRPRAMTTFYQEASATLRALPGIEAVAVVSRPPVEPGSQGDLTIDGQPRRTAPIVTYRRVLPGYFAVLGIPVIEGRDFSDRDGTGEPVTIVSASVARRFWPPGQAVGRRIKVGAVDREPWLRIVGVVGDVRNGALDGGTDLATYEPHAQRPWNGMFVMARTAGEPSAMTDTIRRALRDLDPQVVISSVSTMEERIGESVGSRRFYTIVVGTFAAATLLLVALAIYGVLAYWVTSHTRDLGIRAAVGASQVALVRAVLTEGLRPTLRGLVLGIAGSWIAASAGRALLFEVDPHDPWIYTATAGFVVVVALVSSWLPARRATLIDPSAALRGE
jgi:putative ABC transport system permease protein